MSPLAPTLIRLAVASLVLVPFALGAPFSTKIRGTQDAPSTRVTPKDVNPHATTRSSATVRSVAGDKNQRKPPAGSRSARKSRQREPGRQAG